MQKANISDAVIQRFASSHARAAESYTKARRDNDVIYTEKVPPVATLPIIDRCARGQRFC